MAQATSTTLANKVISSIADKLAKDSHSSESIIVHLHYIDLVFKHNSVYIFNRDSYRGGGSFYLTKY